MYRHTIKQFVRDGVRYISIDDGEIRPICNDCTERLLAGLPYLYIYCSECLSLEEVFRRSSHSTHKKLKSKSR